MDSVDLLTPCEICEEGSRDKDGYAVLYRDGKHIKAHRLAYAEAHGVTLSDLEGVVIRHKCDNPPCRNPDHLLAGTHKDNALDCVSRGRHNKPKGSACYQAKLTEKDVLDIRNSNLSNLKLSKLYGVSTTCIQDARIRKKWKHVA